MKFLNVLKSSGALLPGVAVAVCVAGSLSGYEAPVFDMGLSEVVEAAEETDAAAAKKVKDTDSSSEKKTTPSVNLEGAVDLADCADGTFEGSGQGFQNGKTTVRVTIKDHTITAIEVVDHQDTESYFDQAKSVIDAILSTQSLDVDAVSGATYSSNGIIEAVSNALKRAAGQSVSDDYSGNDGSTSGNESVSISTGSTPDNLADGTYTGSGAGYGGTTTVSVTVSGGKITSVDVISHQDTPSYFSMASPLIDQIIANNGINGLDAVSGATYSSRGILEAVANALSQAGSSSSSSVNVNGGGNSSSGNNSGASVDIEVADTPDTLADGTYTGSGQGFGGTTTLSITVKNGKVSSVQVLEHHDTDSYFSMASGLLDRIVSNNGVNGLDAVSGATYTSRGILQAASNALAKAGSTSGSSDSGNGNNSYNNSNNGNNSSNGQKPSDPVTPSDDITLVKGKFPYLDGTYTGTGEGNGGEITVAVSIKDKTLVSITVLSAEHEDEPFLTNAETLLPQIILNQATDVDTVSGATYSSEGLIDAVINALDAAEYQTKNAEKDPDKVLPPTPADPDHKEDDDPDNEKDPEKDDESDETYPYKDGVYTASVLIDPGEDGDFLPYTLSMELTIEKGAVVSIDNVIGSGDGYEEADLRYINRALNGTSRYAGIAQQVFDKNGLDGVEAVSGATWTSDGLIEMIGEILTLADNENHGSEKDDDPGEIIETGLYQDGVYSSSMLVDPGEAGDFLPYTLTMDMTVENGSIVSFNNVIGSGDGYEEADLRYINRALNGTSKYTGIAQQVFDQNSLNGVEAVSGATWTSKAMIEMIREMILLAQNAE
ncbi:MAG: FMN-binding protein [Lachnospiraceae bacterium]|nr:FMN-binding protein [Lachnospiraceae bacterium]